MRILSIVRRGYYGHSSAIEPMYLYFTEPLRQMGHEVETFDHWQTAERFGGAPATSLLVDKIRDGSFDVSFYQTAGREPIDTSALRDLSKRFCIAAWNSDDDWQWESSTSKIAGDFTFMITTYPHIYKTNRPKFPNLLLSQWGCYPPFGDFARTKDIGFSFAGSVYGARNPACRFLQRKAGLRCFGRGSRLVKLGLPYFKGIFKLSALCGAALNFEEVHSIWNRSRVAYTPMGGGPECQVLSIKGRAFEMGLSGTLMLCELSPNLECYYEPGKEFIVFETLEDCAEKAKFYLRNEAERLRIASNYRDRTMREHLWEHRFSRLFAQMEIKTANAMNAIRWVPGVS